MPRPEAGEFTILHPTHKEGSLEALKERKEPSLGELNPLLFPPDLSRRETVEALRLVIERGIEKYDGLKPESGSVTWVTNLMGRQEPRLVLTWTIPLLKEEQISSLEELTAQIFKPSSVVTRKGHSGIQRRNANFYPKIDVPLGTAKRASFIYSKIGWCFGPEGGDPDCTTEGLLVYREIGNKSVAAQMRGERSHDWFTLENPVDYRGKPIKTQHIVEIRVGESLYQTELVKFVLQTARILNGQQPLSSPELTYDVYNTLNRIGLKERRREDLYGLDEIIDYIQDYLFFPLRNLGETLRRKIEVSSVLLIGVPGTGKTLLAEYFLQQDLGVFLVPIPADIFARDLTKNKKLIDRISSVAQETGIPVVIHVDDIESVGGEETTTVNSILMNLMAGVRERGFFIFASTNNPYDLSYQLLQPQRFGHILHVPLPNEEARLGVLRVHAPEEYFTNLQERENLLREIASDNGTEYFDSRLLKALCDYAQINAMHRDSYDALLTTGDFREALRVAKQRFNREEAKKRERKLEEFANRHRAVRIGFRTPSEPSNDEANPQKLIQKSKFS